MQDRRKELTEHLSVPPMKYGHLKLEKYKEHLPERNPSTKWGVGGDTNTPTPQACTVRARPWESPKDCPDPQPTPSLQLPPVIPWTKRVACGM